MNLFSRWETFAFLSAIFAGLTAFLAKMGLVSINSNLATFIRTLVILSMTACIVSLRGQWSWPQGAGAKAYLFLVLSGIATGLSWLCYYRALSLGPVSKVAPIDKLSVVVAVVLGILFLGEKLTWQISLGAGLILAGAMIIAFL